MTFKLEIGKRYVKRNGETTDVLKQNDHCGMFYTGDEFEQSRAWYSTGAFLTDAQSLNDLIAVHEEPQYYWINVYPSDTPVFYTDEKTALRNCQTHVGGKTVKLQAVKDDE